MTDVLRALTISTGILSIVVALIIFISVAVVRRGEHGHVVADHDVPPDSHAVTATAAAAAAAPAKAGAKPAVSAGDEINVMQILIFGLVLFTLSVLALFALSLIEHLR
jgi:hypothetical protein